LHCRYQRPVQPETIRMLECLGGTTDAKSDVTSAQWVLYYLEDHLYNVHIHNHTDLRNCGPMPNSSWFEATMVVAGMNGGVLL
jgi:hypothetical protein